MQLPQKLQHFPVPTLIVLADHVHAQFWLAHREELNQQETFSLPRERKTDHETSFVNTDHGGGNGPELLDDDRQQHFIRLVADHLASLIFKNHIQAICLVMKAELAHALKKKLSQDKIAMIKKELHADLMKDDILDVIRRIFADPKS